MPAHLDLRKPSTAISATLYGATVVGSALGLLDHDSGYAIAAAAGSLSAADLYCRVGQSKHAILRNFGLFGALRYVLEGLGPELRQYFFTGDLEEEPFNRRERDYVYRTARGLDSSEAFGTIIPEHAPIVRALHTMFPLDKEDLAPYRLTFGDTRACTKPFTITRPYLISGMSYGSISDVAVRALARGAKLAGIPMSTGEGAVSRFHLEEGCDLIYQLGTAKFGARNTDGTLDEAKLEALLTANPQVRMLEVKLSQGAKPGKGGLLPGAKVTQEIATARGVPIGKSVLSPPRHAECEDPATTVRFLRRVQDLSGIPVGIKMCVGRREELDAFVKEMIAQDTFPDYIQVDGGEGGTGAAPPFFMDYVGLRLFPALDTLRETLESNGVRDRTKIIASGKLLMPDKQVNAFAYGADAIAIARGFLFSIGCIQAGVCNTNRCPTGITTHETSLTRGLDPADKSVKVRDYVWGMQRDLEGLLGALGCRDPREITMAMLDHPEVLRAAADTPRPARLPVVGV